MKNAFWFIVICYILSGATGVLVANLGIKPKWKSLLVTVAVVSVEALVFGLILIIFPALR